ncbi:MAG: hypothetical protein C0506_16735, partial [Anaerolinea sp.]|nr:hypothetical protein [Anaerolinea sp.]
CLAWKAGARRGELETDAAGRPLSDAILAILGLLLAFTFSASLSRHEHRREMVVLDSNAIGDFLTCVRLLDPPERTALEEILQRYITARLALTHDGRSPGEFERQIAAIESMHGEMVTHVDRAVRRSTPIVVPLVNTLNELTSSHASRLSAYRDRLPGSIVLTLLLAAIVSMGLAGNRAGAARQINAASTIGFTILFSLVVGVTLDLNQPQQGTIRISQEPLERLARSLEPPEAPPP